MLNILPSLYVLNLYPISVLLLNAAGKALRYINFLRGHSFCCVEETSN
jgi:hypothetical protein